MALPLSRNTTYGVGTIIPSADLNALQDSVVGKKHGLITKQIHGSKLFNVASATVISRDVDGAVPTTAAQSLGLPIELEIGSVITAIRLYMRDAGGETRKFRLDRYTAVTPATTLLATSGNSSGAGTYQTISVGALAVVVITGQALMLTWLINSGSAIGSKVHSVEIDYYRP